MNFRKRELTYIKVTIERNVVLQKRARDNFSIVAYAHKDEELGNQSINVEICDKSTGEFELKQFNIPADVAYILETKEILEIEL